MDMLNNFRTGNQHRTYQMFGLKDNKIYHNRDVNRGLSCNCVCPHCQSPLIARQGNANIHHFAHVASYKDCNYGDQTALHLLAKKILLSAGYLVLPELSVSATAYDVNGAPHTVSKAIPPYTFQIEQVEDEVVLDGIIPDIVIKSGERELLVEIAVTNFVNESKKRWLKQRDKTSIQIDLSKQYQNSQHDWNVDEIICIIIDSVEHKAWISNPRFEQIYKDLLEQAQAEAAKVEKSISLEDVLTKPVRDEDKTIVFWNGRKLKLVKP